jgi:hypothetical protein
MSRTTRPLGAGRAWGAPLAVRRTYPDGFDEFLEDFLEQAIEAQGSSSGAAARMSGSTA